jgi:hypothetical protein
VKSRSRGASASESCGRFALFENRGRRECRVKASPMARVQQKSTRQNHRLSRSSGIPCAMALRLIRALPGAPGFLATISQQRARARCAGHQRRGVETTRFRRAQQLVRPHDQDHAATHCAHRIPRSTSVTVAKRPSCERETNQPIHDFRKKEREIFLQGELENERCAHPARGAGSRALADPKVSAPGDICWCDCRLL